jgi:hypothetical protein
MYTELLIGLAAFAVVIWLLVTYLPMPPVLKQILIVIAALVILVHVLRIFRVTLP